MLKKKIGRPPKKKVIDAFVDPKPKVEDRKPKEEIAAPLPKALACECGNDAYENSNQCWACSHRA